MTLFETLTRLRAGERPASGLLHSCRLHAFGSEAYGEEAVVERFRTMPYDENNEQFSVSTPRHAALFAGAVAIVADLAGDNLARVWRLGPGAPVLPEAGISVTFDPDLSQARGDSFLCVSDHPELADNVAARVVAIGRDLVRSDPSVRARAFAIRAFGSAQKGAALFAMHHLSSNAIRAAGFFHIAVRWENNDLVTVRDTAGEAAVAATPWTPRIG